MPVNWALTGLSADKRVSQAHEGTPEGGDREYQQRHDTGGDGVSLFQVTITSSFCLVVLSFILSFLLYVLDAQNAASEKTPLFRPTIVIPVQPGIIIIIITIII